MASQKPTRPLLRYHGGKWRLAPWIIEHFPPHRVYVEPFGGAASVLLRKEPSYAEVYNDLDEDIVNLFQVTRNNGAELGRLLALTPFARKEYVLAWQPTDDPIEQARRTVIRSFMGFGSAAATRNGKETSTKFRNIAKDGDTTQHNFLPETGFRSNSNRSGTTPAHDWHHFAGTGFKTYTGESDGRRNRHTLPAGDWDTFASCLQPIIERLRGVVIECRDALEVIQAHDGDETLHYVDPPYPKETRSDNGNDYRHELTTEQHRALAAKLHCVRGSVVLSGYACNLYDTELYPDWHRVEREAFADGAKKRTEVLWLNPKCSNALTKGNLSLFDTLPSNRIPLADDRIAGNEG